MQQAYSLAASNAIRMREMHDKLVADIGELEARRAMLKSKAAVARTQERMNKMGSSVTGANASMAAFGRMEEKVERALDEANAMAELNMAPKDDIEELTAKYDRKPDVEDELTALKNNLKIKNNIL